MKQAYESYKRFCQRIGVPPADVETWWKEVQKLPEFNYSFIIPCNAGFRA